MAEFEPAVEVVLDHEGGYSNHPSDPGGETKFGISRRSYPHVDIEGLTRDAAKAIYFDDWWQKYRWRDIQSQVIATKVFDLAVNMDAPPAHRILQRALRAVGERVEEDGRLGPITIAAVNRAPQFALLAAIRSEAAGFYRSLNKPHFERGWLARAYS